MDNNFNSMQRFAASRGIGPGFELFSVFLLVTMHPENVTFVRQQNLGQ